MRKYYEIVVCIQRTANANVKTKSENEANKQQKLRKQNKIKAKGRPMLQQSKQTIEELTELKF